MITPSYSLTATERVLPRLALDFTTATLDPRVTFTRSGNTATVINSSGVIVGVNADIPRFDYNPTTLVCNGLLIEESRTNVLLNSLIDGTILGTQAVVVTAAARTLSFYGTGQIVLSGAHSATVTGTGAYPARTTLTFTPSAGVLTLTVTGTVQFAQLELGSFATSYIPTTASQVTRSADVATMTGTNFSNWYNATEGTMSVGLRLTPRTPSGTAIILYNGDATGRWSYLVNSSARIFDNTNTATAGNVVATGALNKIVSGFSASGIAIALNGATTATSSFDGTFGPATSLLIGSQAGTGNINATFAYINYYPQKLTNAEMQAFSK